MNESISTKYKEIIKNEVILQIVSGLLLKER
jgi:hypothetical protein